MLDITPYRSGDETRMQEIAPRAFGVWARFGIDKTLPRDRTQECYRREALSYAQRVAAGEDGFVVLVAREGAEVVGYIALGLNPSLSATFGFKWGSIISLAVDPDRRGRGIGTRLVQAGLHWLRDQGVVCAEVFTDQNNIAAIRAYENCGFRVIHCGLTLSQFLREPQAPE
jgi:ribosomal protein S18 acetylase RimI-like enzyme